MEQETLNSILNSLKITLGVTEASDIIILEEILTNAIKEIKQARRYPPNLTEYEIALDMANYEANVKKLASYDYGLLGGEGESSHSENGVSRSYFDRAKCFYGVLPYCNMF
jgi:hypothetical protein